MWSISKATPLKTWWPSLHPDVCALVAGLDTWDIPNIPWKQAHLALNHPLVSSWWPAGFGCSTPEARNKTKTTAFYVCPREG